MLSVADILPQLLKGAWVTIQVTLMAGVLALSMAFLAGLGRLARSHILRGLSRVYIEFFRGTSALVQLYWLFFALPLLGVRMEAMLAGVIGLGLHVGAYGAEVVRASILAVPQAQVEGAIALNMSRGQIMRRVLVPQALPIMLPPFGNLSVELLKATALVSLITITDLTFQAQLLRGVTLQTPMIFSTVLVIYFIIAFSMTSSIRAIERRVSRGLDRGGLTR